MRIRGEYWWIRPHGGGVDWAQCSSGETVPVQEGVCDSVGAVPAPAGARLVLCVQGEKARIHKVNLPAANRRQIMAALPFALEDRLLHDVDAYHLVPLPIGNDTRDIPVVVTEKTWLSALLEECAGSGWQPVLLAPDYQFMPEPVRGHWLVDASTQPLLLRKPGREGAVLGGEVSEQVPGTLLLALEQADTLPVKVIVRVSNHQQYNAVTGWSPILEQHSIDLEIILDEQPRSAWLARQPLPDARSNLLTGAYAVKRSQWTGLGRLKIPFALAALFLVISTTHWILQGIRMQTEQDDLQQAIAATYRRVFPEAVNLVDPRFQMEQQLARLRSGEADGRAGSDFLVRMDKLAEVLSIQPDCQVQQISFDGSVIMLEVSVADYESFERLQRQLAQSAAVNVENAQLKDGRVFGRIRIGNQA